MVVIKHASRRKVNSTRVEAGERVFSASKASAATREYSSRGAARCWSYFFDKLAASPDMLTAPARLAIYG